MKKIKGASCVLDSKKKRDEHLNYYGDTGEMHKQYFFITWPKNFVFGQVLFSSACMCLSVCVCVCVCVCLSVCVSVCESVAELSQKVLDRF